MLYTMKKLILLSLLITVTVVNRASGKFTVFYCLHGTSFVQYTCKYLSKTFLFIISRYYAVVNPLCYYNVHSTFTH